MADLLIRGALLNGAPHDVTIDGGVITSVRPAARKAEEAGHDLRPHGLEGRQSQPPAARVIDAHRLHAFPSFKNGHTHASMALFRGWGDDMPLMEWLETRIWPVEKKLSEDDVYHGARLGILEMIRGGTTFFNDMYWHRPGVVRAVEELGVRAWVGQTLIDVGIPGILERQKLDLVELARNERARDGRVRLVAAPHSIYTVPPDTLRWVADVANELDLPIHIHLSETAGEVERCVAEHGCRPALLLDRLGLVSDRLVAVHGQFLDDDELDLLGRAGATLVTNPAANMKLATGGVFPYTRARAAGVRVCLGTDGAASNNSLSMVEAMKLAALVQKHADASATTLPAAEALALATVNASAAFDLGPGEIAPGAPADLILVDFSGPATQPVHDPVSTLVYAATAANVHTTICAGRVLMHDRRIEVCDEAEVIAAAARVVERLFG